MDKTSSPPATAPPRRNPLHTDALVERPKPGINTVTDILFYNAHDQGTRNALGWRDIVDMGRVSLNSASTRVRFSTFMLPLREWILPIIAPYAMLLFHVPPAQTREPSLLLPPQNRETHTPSDPHGNSCSMLVYP